MAVFKFFGIVHELCVRRIRATSQTSVIDDASYSLSFLSSGLIRSFQNSKIFSKFGAFISDFSTAGLSLCCTRCCFSSRINRYDVLAESLVFLFCNELLYDDALLNHISARTLVNRL